MSVAMTVRKLKQHDQDYEYYPTSPSMIATIKAYIEKHDLKTDSVLDLGAGDGRIVTELSTGVKYAIEKSQIHINAMPRDINIIGTDFEDQSLIDKKVSLIFTNPPYSEFTSWLARILKEAYCLYTIAIIPTRWRDNGELTQLMEERGIKHEIIDTTDFLDAERSARAKVDIVFFDFCDQIKHRNSRYGCGDHHNRDPFEIWFEDFFGFEKHMTLPIVEESEAVTWKSKVANSLVDGNNVIDTLVELYTAELAHICDMYQKITMLDPDVLRGMDINVKGVREGLKLKITNLKHKYWEEMFNRFTTVTKHLCTKQRAKMRERLMTHVNVEFSKRNAHAIASWLVKNANHYYDDQVTQLMKDLTCKASVVNYKSNERVFKHDGWRYSSDRDKWTHYKLDYRFVIEGWYGINCSEYDFERNAHRGLRSSGYNLLSDLLTVANNIGFQAYHDLQTRWFESRSKQEFYYLNHRTGESELLFECRAYNNGNIHFRFAPRFMLALNTEFGRVNGWVKSKEEAAQELQANIEEIKTVFGTNNQIALGSFTHLLANAA
jgi:hypothetical protein